MPSSHLPRILPPMRSHFGNTSLRKSFRVPLLSDRTVFGIRESPVIVEDPACVCADNAPGWAATTARPRIAVESSQFFMLLANRQNEANTLGWNERDHTNPVMQSVWFDRGKWDRKARTIMTARAAGPFRRLATKTGG